MTKKTIKEEILRKLGFSAAPNVTFSTVSELPYVQQQINEVRLSLVITKNGTHEWEESRFKHHFFI